MFLTLAYHLVGEYEKDYLSISPETFDKHIDTIINEGYTFINIEEAKMILRRDLYVKNGILLTFDDGYKNTIDIVLPYLVKKNIPAIMCVCSDYIINKNYSDYHKNYSFASYDEICRWIEQGFSIGAHSQTHKLLTRLTEAELETEIYEDKLYLEKMFNFNIEYFFYPFGAGNSLTRKVAKKLFFMAFATNNGLIPDIYNRHFIYRYEIKNKLPIESFRNMLNDKKTLIAY